VQKPIFVFFCPASLFLLDGTHVASLVIVLFGVELVTANNVTEAICYAIYGSVTTANFD
jgi:hypothetical protein